MVVGFILIGSWRLVACSFWGVFTLSLTLTHSFILRSWLLNKNYEKQELFPTLFLNCQQQRGLISLTTSNILKTSGTLLLLFIKTWKHFMEFTIHYLTISPTQSTTTNMLSHLMLTYMNLNAKFLTMRQQKSALFKMLLIILSVIPAHKLLDF